MGRTLLGGWKPHEDSSRRPRPHLELRGPNGARGSHRHLHRPPGYWWQRGCGSTCRADRLLALGGSGPSRPPSSRQHQGREERSGGVQEALWEAATRPCRVWTGLPKPLASTAVSSETVPAQCQQMEQLTHPVPPPSPADRGAPPGVSTKGAKSALPRQYQIRVSPPKPAHLTQFDSLGVPRSCRVWRCYPGPCGR